MNIQNLFTLVGGLGLFFFGMRTMSDGLKKIAGERLKAILSAVTKLPIFGVLAGAVITCLVQSSTATSIMVVGFVNAGLMALNQAVSVIIGANIGTTFTAWLVSFMAVFKVTNYALPAIGVGFGVNIIGKSRNMRFWGQVLMGFGLLFLGLSFMQESFEPLRNSEMVRQIFLSFGDNPLLGVLVGMVFTMLLQSSSATIAVVQVLAFNGLITFPAAIPIILGDNIGTTITAMIASSGTTLSARRTAVSHALFNVIGVGYMLIFVYTGWFVNFIEFIVPGKITSTNIMFYIAVAHSAFNIFNAMLFLPFISKLTQLSRIIVPRKPGAIEIAPQYLEKHLLDTPPIALEQARRETVRMMNLACDSVSRAVRSFLMQDITISKPVPKLEEAVDNLQSAITQYLVELSQKELSPEESEELPVLIHNVNDIERIGDHAENILELSERKHEKKYPFTEEAMEQLANMWNELEDMMKITTKALIDNDEDMAGKVIRRESIINELQIKLKKGHVKRLNKGKCKLKSGIIFMDFVDNLEKIGDYLTNVAQGIKGHMRWVLRETPIDESMGVDIEGLAPSESLRSD